VADVGVPLPLRLADLLAGVSLRRRRAGKQRKRWAIPGVRDEEKMLRAEVTK